MSWLAAILFVGVALAALAAWAGLFTALEAALLGVNRQALHDREEEGDSRAAAALALFARPRRILGASLVTNLLALLLAAGLVQMWFEMDSPLKTWRESLPDSIAWLLGPVFWAVVILTPLFLLVAEIIPRRWSRAHAQGSLWVGNRFIHPLVRRWLLVAGALIQPLSALFRRMGLAGALEPVRLTREDLQALVEFSPSHKPSAAAAAPESQRGMIQSILAMGETLVREVMRPLGEVVAIRLGEMTPEQMIEFARRHPYTRYPVYRERMIDLIGYINVYDLVSEDLEGRRLEEFLHDALYVPETARLDTLLEEFIRQKTQCAIVFDEHGTCSGWVTREDMFEVILGDLNVEGDPGLLHIRQENESNWLVDPRIDLDHLNRLFDISLEKIHCETLGGYVYSVLGRVPVPGERIELRRWTIEVVEMDHHIIRCIRLFRRPETLPHPEGGRGGAESEDSPRAK